KLALEPVSIYISRATQKLYVRRNTHKPLPDGGVVFDSTIEVPITIRDPGKRIGTHVFTAECGARARRRGAAGTRPSPGDTPASPPRRMYSTPPRRPRCRDPRLSSRTSP